VDLPETVPQEAQRKAQQDAPRADSELYQHREQPPAYGVDPQDGLPRPFAESSYEETYVPPLEPRTLICMADTSEFHLKVAGQVLVFTRDEVIHDERGYSVPYRIAIERLGPERQHEIFVDMKTTRTPVEPARKACKHYVRQMTDLSGHHDRRFIARFCTALRDENGDYLSLRDGLMYACELRDPREPVSEKLLDEFDAQKISEGRERNEETVEHEFDVDAALKQQQDLGIFSR
jgi:hypothetical protein